MKKKIIAPLMQIDTSPHWIPGPVSYGTSLLRL